MQFESENRKTVNSKARTNSYGSVRYSMGPLTKDSKSCIDDY